MANILFNSRPLHQSKRQSSRGSAVLIYEWDDAQNPLASIVSDSGDVCAYANSLDFALWRISCSTPVPCTKKTMENDTFSIVFFIHCESNSISSPLGVYHHRRCSSSAVGCILFRNDDIQNFVLIICNFFEIDDIQGSALIFYVNLTVNRTCRWFHLRCHSCCIVV